MRMQGRVVSACLSGWRDNMRSLRRYKEVVGRVVGRMRARSLYSCLERWTEHVGSAMRHQGICKAVVRRLMMRSASAALNRWHEAIAVLKHVRSILSKVLLRIQFSLLGNAFFSWTCFRHSSISRKQRICRAANHFFGVFGLSILHQWILFVKSSRRIRYNVLKIWAKSSSLLLSNCFVGWKNMFFWKKKSALVAGCILRRAEDKSRLRNMYTWRRICLHEKRLKGISSKIIGRMRNYCASMAINTWSSNVKDLQKHRSALEKSTVLIQSC
jgi:hypothetical protein